MKAEVLFIFFKYFNVLVHNECVGQSFVYLILYAFLFLPSADATDLSRIKKTLFFPPLSPFFSTLSTILKKYIPTEIEKQTSTFVTRMYRILCKKINNSFYRMIGKLSFLTETLSVEMSGEGFSTIFQSIWGNSKGRKAGYLLWTLKIRHIKFLCLKTLCVFHALKNHSLEYFKQFQVQNSHSVCKG